MSVLVPAESGDATARIQAALDMALRDPVSVTLGPGEHVTGGLRIHSGTHLTFAEGAVLRFRSDYDAYTQTTVAVEAEQSNRAMITAEGAESIRITGTGRIECDGVAGFSRGEDAMMGTRLPKTLRPRVMVLDGCRDVAIDGIEVMDAPMWTLHFVGCAGLRLSNLRIENDQRMPNTDGVVIDGCSDVIISDCEIRTADDGVVLKTSARLDGKPAQPCCDIEIRDCVIQSQSCALKIGTESFADFSDIAFLSCQVEGSNRALGIFSRDGGAVRGVRFEDITLDCHETPGGFWGSGEPVTINALDRRPEVRPAGEVAHVQIRRIAGTASGAINLFAERPGMIRDVTLDGIDLTQFAGPLGTAMTYDLRPTPVDLVPSKDAAGRVNAWRMGADGRIIGLSDYPDGLPAVFASGVADLNLGTVDVRRPDPLPDGWSETPVTLERTG